MVKHDDRYVERGSVNGVEWMHSRSRMPRGLVVAPPLIGGHALQQLRLLRPLVRRHLDPLSFSYAGHGASQGVFSVQASIENCLSAIDLATTMCRTQKIPLYGVASCFAAMPMLHALSQRGEPLKRLVLINALPHLPWEKMVFDFYRFWRLHRQWRLTPRGLKEALKAYRRELLPHVTHSRQAFGILSRQRVHWSRIFSDLFAYRRCQVQPLHATPVLCVYGRKDLLLQQIGFSDWDGYEMLMKQICPRAEFQRIDGDHFLAGAEVRGRLIETVVTFLSSSVPTPSIGPRVHKWPLEKRRLPCAQLG